MRSRVMTQHKNMSIRAIFTVLLTALALPAQALTPAGEVGEPVLSIDSADQISDWSALDNKHVLLNMHGDDTYLITLNQQCPGLTWARNVTVSMSNNTIWAGFDAIKADGLACPIERISKVSAQELLELKL